MDPRILPRLPAGADPGSWGWIDAQGAHQTFDPADAIDALAADTQKQIQFAWRPEHLEPDRAPRLRPVYEVFPGATLGRDAAARSRTKARERSALLVSACAIAALLWMLWSGQDLPPIVVLAVLLFAMTPFERAIDYVENGFAERLSQRDPGEAARRGATRLRYALWAGAQRRSIAGILLVALFAGLFLVQQQVGWDRSLELAGLVKPRVAAEPYRLLTAAYLHGGLLHILFNGYMTLIMARVLDPLIGAGRTLIVFVLGALAGNLASTWLLAAPSLGASGGIMAFVGVLAGLALRRKELRGVGLHRIALRIFVLMAIAGLVGSHMIDSAAHGGGALAGVVLGAVFAGAVGDERIQRPVSLINLLGVATATLPALWTLRVLWPYLR